MAVKVSEKVIAEIRAGAARKDEIQRRIQTSSQGKECAGVEAGEPFEAQDKQAHPTGSDGDVSENAEWLYG
jgi:hypothetical protein